MAAALLTPLITSGSLAQNILRVRLSLRDRYLALCSALREADPKSQYISFTDYSTSKSSGGGGGGGGGGSCGGGYFVWIRLVCDKLRASELRSNVFPGFGVDALPGEWCSASGKDLSGYLRLSFAYAESIQLLKAGATRLVAAIKSASDAAVTADGTATAKK